MSAVAVFPSGSISQAVFKHALEALNGALNLNAPADAVLSKYFRDNRELGSRDRGWVAAFEHTIVVTNGKPIIITAA